MLKFSPDITHLWSWFKFEKNWSLNLNNLFSTTISQSIYRHYNWPDIQAAHDAYCLTFRKMIPYANLVINLSNNSLKLYSSCVKPCPFLSQHKIFNLTQMGQLLALSILFDKNVIKGSCLNEKGVKMSASLFLLFWKTIQKNAAQNKTIC